VRSNYQVGQIIYLFSDKTMKVFPVQVVEEVVRNSLKGSRVTYTVVMPDKKRTVIGLDKVNARIFDEIASLKLFMEDNSRKSIKHILESAVSLSSVFEILGENIESDHDQKIESHVPEITDLPEDKLIVEEASSNVQTKGKPGTIKVDIGNGIKANIKVEDLTGLSILND
jgi:hypothetical protein